MHKNFINSKQQTSKLQSGFSLIEVLIAIIIVSLGLLGIVRMQILNIKYMNDSKNRSIATQLANDIIDRIRANKVEAELGSYLIGWGGAVPVVPACESATANCSTSDLADFDIATWLCSLGNYNAEARCVALGIEGQLSSGQGRITYDATTDIASVRIRWRNQIDKATRTNVTMNFKL